MAARPASALKSTTYNDNKNMDQKGNLDNIIFVSMKKVEYGVWTSHSRHIWIKFFVLGSETKYEINPYMCEENEIETTHTIQSKLVDNEIVWDFWCR